MIFREPIEPRPNRTMCASYLVRLLLNNKQKEGSEHRMLLWYSSEHWFLPFSAEMRASCISINRSPVGSHEHFTGKHFSMQKEYSSLVIHHIFLWWPHWVSNHREISMLTPGLLIPGNPCTLGFVLEHLKSEDLCVDVIADPKVLKPTIPMVTVLGLGTPWFQLCSHSSRWKSLGSAGSTGSSWNS